MRSYRLLLCCLALIAVCALPSMGQLGVGTRAIGMGGAFTAIADDTSAPYWNPAGLAKVKGFHLLPLNVQARIKSNLDWQDLVKNPPTTDEDRLGLLKELTNGTSTIDFSANTGLIIMGVAVSVIPSVTANLDATGVVLDPATNEPAITFNPVTGAPEVNSTASMTGAANASVGVSFARKVKSGSIGFTLKSIRGVSFDQTLRYKAKLNPGGDPTKPSDYSLEDASPDAVTTDKSGLGIDFGYLRDVSANTTCGVMVRNLIAPNIDGIDRQVNIGVAHKAGGGRVTLAADIQSLFSKPSLNLGAEARPVKALALWAGIYERKPTLGLGLNLLGLNAQFAYSPKNKSIMSGSIYF